MGRNPLQKGLQRIVGGDGTVLNLNYGGGCRTVCICQNSYNWALKMGEFYSMLKKKNKTCPGFQVSTTPREGSS